LRFVFVRTTSTMTLRNLIHPSGIKITSKLLSNKCHKISWLKNLDKIYSILIKIN
jgi:hypothetical protein